MKSLGDDGYSSSFKGQFLIAMPNLMDPHFYQTVVCICEHNVQGAVGIVVNRIHPFLTGKDIFDEISMKYNQTIASIPVFAGGPVHSGEIFILHKKPFGWQGCLMITQTLAMSNTMDILQELALGRGPKSYIISLGCAGWGPGQLDAEIKQNAWLTGKILEDVIFEVQIEDRWDATLKAMGIDPLLLSAAAGNA